MGCRNAGEWSQYLEALCFVLFCYLVEGSAAKCAPANLGQIHALRVPYVCVCA